jgi:hypothetical protein
LCQKQTGAVHFEKSAPVRLAIYFNEMP